MCMTAMNLSGWEYIQYLKKNQVLLGTFLNVFDGCLSHVIVRDGCGFEILLLFYKYL
jgi:hypothetical protein